MSGNSDSSLSRIPATAIQALYYAATGKTENLTKNLQKNFIIRKTDLDQLYFKIMQQLDHYETIAEPTITVKVRLHNEESQQYSSWERFNLFDTGKAEIVSEIVLKFEFILKLPGLGDVQRYIISIDLDSQLPMLADDNEAGMPLEFVRFFPQGFPSLTASIDFIDYLCAKNFMQVIEDWFKALEETPHSKLRIWASKFPIPWSIFFSHFSNLGAAAFIALYAYLRGNNLGSSSQIAYLGSVTIVAWTISTLLCRHLGYSFASVVSKSFVPPSLILTTGDQRAFSKALERAKSAKPKSFVYALTAISAIALNVLASYLYEWMTR